jgi:ubiquinone/menaquinone biosynthesis C-methylase UbiE
VTARRWYPLADGAAGLSEEPDPPLPPARDGGTVLDPVGPAGRAASEVTEAVRRHYDERPPEPWVRTRLDGYWRSWLVRALRVHVPPGRRVLEIGCGDGGLLAALLPSHGVGIDLSRRRVEEARRAHPEPSLSFVCGDASDPDVLAGLGGPFDAVVLVNVATELADVLGALRALHAVCTDRTRVYVYSYSRVWQPVRNLARLLGLRGREPPQSWLPSEEVRALLRLADLEPVRKDAQIVCPVPIPVLSHVLNRFVGHLPLIEPLSLMFGIVARPRPRPVAAPVTTSVVIPCRNEAGHVRDLVGRLPDLGPGSEFVFVEGHSTDGTADVIRDVLAERPERPFRLVGQPGRGKGDAVRAGFAVARGDVLAVLDGDLSVAPEDLPRFVEILKEGKGELVNGSRMVYPMEGRAMPFLNLLGNKLFAFLFTWILGQQVRDTLCGTKVLWRRDYEEIAAARAFFGEFDPFGDFDLLFGAARLDLKVVDLPVRYHERRYGRTNISRFRHGWLLLRMSAFAASRLKWS